MKAELFVWKHWPEFWKWELDVGATVTVQSEDKHASRKTAEHAGRTMAKNLGLTIRKVV